MEQDHQKRYIELEGTLNMRDLGGYPTEDGARDALWAGDPLG